MDSEDLRLTVLDLFRRGRTPRVSDLCVELGVATEDVRAGLTVLATSRHVALGRR